MASYQSGEIVLLQFPFSNMTGAKRRPALILLDMGDIDVVIARITSQAPQAAFDVALTQWQQAGLLLTSVVRLHKLATVEKRLVERRFGHLLAGDWAQARTTLHQLWSSI